MKPSFRRAGNPAFRTSTFAALLLSATPLAGCATAQKPPEISYDDAAPAVQTVDPPAPVQVVELPRPLPLPGQMKPVEERRRPPEPTDPAARINQANAAARVQPVRDGFINAMQVYPWTQGALYQVYTAVGQITDIALQPGEQLVGAGPVAAGDTVRWIIGDTQSGSGATTQVHILVKPTRADLMTNLVINTNLRTYHMELRSTERTYMASVSWQYPQDQLIALRRQNAQAEAARPVAPASTSPTSTSATPSRATARRGGRSAPMTTGGRSSSSSRGASPRERCRRCSWSARRATPPNS